MTYVHNVLERLKNKQTRDTTTQNYLGIRRHLNKFLINLDHLDRNLTWEDRTALFGAYLVDNGIQSSTLKSYFSAIKHVLRQGGYSWNDNTFLLSSLIRSCKLQNDKVKVRLPIKKGLLEMLLFEIKRTYKDAGQNYLYDMYIAILCLTYYGMLRVGEITQGPHTLKACNVHVGDNKEKIMVVLYTSKTHGQESSPQEIKISAVRSDKKHVKFFCPVKAVIKFMQTRGCYHSIQEHFFVVKDKTLVRLENFKTTLRSMLRNIGLDGSLYDVHSFRSRRTCDLAKFGYSVDQIKDMDHW